MVPKEDEPAARADPSRPSEEKPVRQRMSAAGAVIHFEDHVFRFDHGWSPFTPLSCPLIFIISLFYSVSFSLFGHGLLGERGGPALWSNAHDLRVFRQFLQSLRQLVL